MTTNETVKGFNDYTGEEAKKREEIRKILVKNFELYGFEPAETPIVEFEEFVKGDNEYDEAVSDIFKLQDKGMRKLALRYELTFQLKRIASGKKLPYKRYSIGAVFRDEPTSSNRFRQFTQCDADIIGSNTRDESEILALINSIMKELKIEAEIQVNSRKLLNSVIKSLGIDNVEYVVRELDKIDKQGEDAVKMEMNKFIDKETIVKLLSILRKPLTFFRKYEGYKELKELMKVLGYYSIKPVFKPALARGLSYYNGTVFEVKTREMKETITAGGSYLINGIQSTGVSFGLERLCQLARIRQDEKKVLIINIGQDEKSISLAEKLRKKGFSITLTDKITKGLEYANSCNIEKVIFIGDEEIKKKKLKLRDMKSGEEIMISETRLIEELRTGD